MPSWLAIPREGPARRIGGLGLLVGRAPTCDIVLDHAEVSRRHLLLQFGLPGRLDILPLPGARTERNGVVLAAAVPAEHGDTLAFPGGTTIRLERAEAEEQEPVAWMLEAAGRRIGLREAAVRLGGGRGDPPDDIVIEGWPPQAARLSWKDGAPVVEADRPGLLRNGVKLAPGRAVALRPSDRLELAGRRVTFVIATREPEPTHRGDDRPRSIALEMLPTGGMITLSSPAGDRRVLLAERRFALASILLAPPPPLRAGEYIPDEVVFAAVWPRNQSVDRGDLNQLVVRFRADLEAAGADGKALVERFAKGGATRFVVEPDTTITTIA